MNIVENERPHKRTHNGKDRDPKRQKALRSGKWTYEEEMYANRLIVEFESGHLVDCEDGCTLRAFLARKLNCAPMRISKKFAGRCIGKLVFVRRPRKPEMEGEESILEKLEEDYQRSCQQHDEGLRSSSTSSESASEDGLDLKDSDTSETELGGRAMPTISTLHGLEKAHVNSELGPAFYIGASFDNDADNAYDFDNVAAREGWWSSLPAETDAGFELDYSYLNTTLNLASDPDPWQESEMPQTEDMFIQSLTYNFSDTNLEQFAH